MKTKLFLLFTLLSLTISAQIALAESVDFLSEKLEVTTSNDIDEEQYNTDIFPRKSFTKYWKNIKISDVGQTGWYLETDIDLKVLFEDRPNGQNINYCVSLSIRPTKVIDPKGRSYTRADIGGAIFNSIPIEFNAINANIRSSGRLLTPYEVFRGGVSEATPLYNSCITKNKSLWYESNHPNQRSLGNDEERTKLFESNFTLEFTDINAKFQNRAFRQILTYWSNKGIDYLEKGNCPKALESFQYFIDIGGSEQFISKYVEDAEKCGNVSSSGNRTAYNSQNKGNYRTPNRSIDPNSIENVKKAVSNAANTFTDAMVTGISEEVITGIELTYNSRAREVNDSSDRNEVMDGYSIEFGFILFDTASLKFGYGVPDGFLYDSMEGSVYTFGLDYEFLTLAEDEGKKLMTLGLGAQFGFGEAVYSDTNSFSNVTTNATDNATFYGVNVNMRIFKFLKVAYGYGLFNGDSESTVGNGPTVLEDTSGSYTWFTAGLSISF